MPPHHRFTIALVALTVCALLPPAKAQDMVTPGPISLPQSAPDFVLLDVSVVLKGSTGDSVKDSALVDAARAAAAFGPGDRYNQILADGAALRMRRIAGVRNATYSLQQRINPDGVTLVFTIEAQRGGVAPEARGILNGGAASDIPLLYQSDRSLLSLMINGGSGIFRDGQAWFGAPGVFTKNNPLVPRPVMGAGVLPP